MADDGDRKKSLASESVTNDYDSPWKEILETYFEECMAFFFPDVHRDIDWSRDHEFLDKGATASYQRRQSRQTHCRQACKSLACFGRTGLGARPYRSAKPIGNSL